jgi:FMN phosphatase YigB (HAD superfamily)
MPLEAVTFDFHDTLMTCDRWFDVEVYTLVPAVLEQLDKLHHASTTPATRDEGRRRYRDLRRRVIQNGVEQDAIACVRQVLDELGLHVAAEVVEAAVAAVMQATLCDATPVDGAPDTVRELSRHGVVLGVVSSAVYHPFLEWSLRRFGMLDAFDAVVTSASCGYYKSRPEIYRHALDTLAIDASHAVHVGDSYEYDVVGARSAGMRTVWFDRLGASSGDNLADLTIRHLTGLAPVVLAHF